MLTNIMRPCPKCNGNGSYGKDTPVGKVLIDPCPRCEGTMYVNIALIDIEDLLDTVSDIKDKCNDIFEKLMNKKR